MASDDPMPLYVKKYITGLFAKNPKPFEHFTNISSIKQYWCKGCDDKFIFKSNFINHMSRDTLKITYNCKHCGKKCNFSNKCLMLDHITSHDANFNVNDVCLSDIEIETSPHSNTNFTINMDENIVSLETFKYLKENKFIDAENYVPEVPKPVFPKNITNLGAHNTNIPCIMKEINDKFDEAMKYFENDYEPVNGCDNIQLEQISNDFIQQDSTNTQSNEETNMMIDTVNDLEQDEEDDTIRSNIQNGNYCCSFCSFTFGTYKAHAKVARREHFQYTRSNIMCKDCNLLLTNNCSYQAHQSIHTLEPPFVCPECGFTFVSPYLYYKHVNAYCYHLTKRAISACSIKRCKTFFPYEYFKKHFMKNHITSIIRCPKCPATFFSFAKFSLHARDTHCSEKITRDKCFVCSACSLTFPSMSDMEKHFKLRHERSIKCRVNFYKCPGCYKLFYPVSSMRMHASTCCLYKDSKYAECVGLNVPNDFKSKLNTNALPSDIVQKICKNCNVISMLKDSNENQNDVCIKCCIDIDDVNPEIINIKRNRKTLSLMKQMTENNPMAIDTVKLTVSRTQNKKILIDELCPNNSDSAISSKTSTTLTINSKFVCAKCQFTSKDKILFSKHVMSHRDNSTTYQCMDCGLCFLTRQALSNHLMKSHNVIDTDDYIKVNKCKNDTTDCTTDSPTNKIKENQCEVCLDQFQNSADLDKHFRIHGMAFILSKQKNKNA